MFNNLRELILSMPTEETCREYLIQQRWNGKPECPYCGCGKVYRIEKGERFKCGSKECYKKFSATVGTIMEASKAPLVKWFTAIYLIGNHKKGISSYQLARDIGVTQQTGWFMLHRIREMMRPKEQVKLDNIVEIDECWIGGKVEYMTKKKKAALRLPTGGTMQNKTMVMGMIERGGNIKLMSLEQDNRADVLLPIIRENVDTDAVIITDGLSSYKDLRKEFNGHEVVSHHIGEYVKDGVIHTNSIEGAFSLLKRSIIGIYHSVSSKHLSRYCDETVFRYNFRKMKDADRFTFSLKSIEGRLKYKTLVNTPDYKKRPVVTSVYITPPEELQAKVLGRPVYQMKKGQIVGRYNSIKEAEDKTGVKKEAISKACRGVRRTTGGFGWQFA